MSPRSRGSTVCRDPVCRHPLTYSSSTTPFELPLFNMSAFHPLDPANLQSRLQGQRRLAGQRRPDKGDKGDKGDKRDKGDKGDKGDKRTCTLSTRDHGPGTSCTRPRGPCVCVWTCTLASTWGRDKAVPVPQHRLDNVAKVPGVAGMQQPSQPEEPSTCQSLDLRDPVLLSQLPVVYNTLGNCSSLNVSAFLPLNPRNRDYHVRPCPRSAQSHGPCTRWPSSQAPMHPWSRLAALPAHWGKSKGARRTSRPAAPWLHGPAIAPKNHAFASHAIPWT